MDEPYHANDTASEVVAMELWTAWFQAVASLRPACTRWKTFAWMVVVLSGVAIRPELAGVTSIVRVLDLAPSFYLRLLALFHSRGLKLDLLTALWVRWCGQAFTPHRLGSYLICLADGLKVPKEGRKMPAVKKLHQSSTDNTKAPFIFGHSLQVLCLLVAGPAGHAAAVPLAARIHEGLVWSNRDRRTLLDKLVLLFRPIAETLAQPVLLVADAYYASRKIILPLLSTGHQLLSRARTNAVAYELAPPPTTRRRGRPRRYGPRVKLRALFQQPAHFTTIPSPIYGEHGVQLSYRVVDLLWRPVARLVRFVLVDHPQRGRIILLCTDLQLDPVDLIILYAYRYKIELSFRHALHVIGVYAYHFWMLAMTPLRRVSGNQHLHRKTEKYRQQVRRKLHAYHAHIQLGCIAQGLLQYLALHFSTLVWQTFRSWLRTMKLDLPPSELVVAYALRATLTDFLRIGPADAKLRKFLARVIGSAPPLRDQRKAA
jgi:DDE superfamily endonuclease